METSSFAVAVSAFVDALQGRLASNITEFPELFTDDAVMDVPFDGAGDAAPIVGWQAIERMTGALEGFLWFDDVTFHDVHSTEHPDVLICEYESVLRRADREGQLRRRYISVITLREGRIAHLREYGGPFMPMEAS